MNLGSGRAGEERGLVEERSALVRGGAQPKVVGSFSLPYGGWTNSAQKIVYLLYKGDTPDEYEMEQRS